MRLASCLLVLAVAACSDDAPDGAGTAPEISLGAASLAFGAISAGLPPPSRTVRVDNGGSGNLVGLSAQVTYPVGQPRNWLLATLSSEGAPSLLGVEVVSTALPAGTYQATIQVASSLSGVEPDTVAVSYAVDPSPALELVPASVSFTGPPESGALAQPVEVRNSGGGTAEGLRAVIEYASGQPTGWLTIFLSAAETPTMIFLTARTGTLASGTYTATVRVTSSNASNSPASFIVTLTVT